MASSVSARPLNSYESINSLERLTDDMLAEIFFYVIISSEDQTITYNRLSITCKRWNYICERYIGVDTCKRSMWKIGSSVFIIEKLWNVKDPRNADIFIFGEDHRNIKCYKLYKDFLNWIAKDQKVNCFLECCEANQLVFKTKSNHKVFTNFENINSEVKDNLYFFGWDISQIEIEQFNLRNEYEREADLSNAFPRRTKAMIETLQLVRTFWKEKGRTKAVFIAGENHVKNSENITSFDYDLGPLYNELKDHKAVILICPDGRKFLSLEELDKRLIELHEQLNTLESSDLNQKTDLQNRNIDILIRDIERLWINTAHYKELADLFINIYMRAIDLKCENRLNLNLNSKIIYGSFNQFETDQGTDSYSSCTINTFIFLSYITKKMNLQEASASYVVDEILQKGKEKSEELIKSLLQSPQKSYPTDTTLLAIHIKFGVLFFNIEEFFAKCFSRYTLKSSEIYKANRPLEVIINANFSDFLAEGKSDFDIGWGETDASDPDKNQRIAPFNLDSTSFFLVNTGDDKKEFLGLLENIKYVRESIQREVIAIIQCNGYSYGLACIENNSDAIFIIFDSNGSQRLNKSRNAFIYYNSNLNESADFLTNLIQYRFLDLKYESLNEVRIFFLY